MPMLAIGPEPRQGSDRNLTMPHWLALAASKKSWLETEMSSPHGVCVGWSKD